MGFWPSWAPDIYVVQTYMQPRHPLTSNNEFFKKNNFNKRTSGVVSPCCAYTYYVISHCTIVWEGQKGLFPTLQPYGPEDGWNLAGMGLQSNSTLPAWGHMTQVLLTTMFYPYCTPPHRLHSAILLLTWARWPQFLVPWGKCLWFQSPGSCWLLKCGGKRQAVVTCHPNTCEAEAGGLTAT